MNASMAEQWFKDGGSGEFVVIITMAPDTILMLFVDGSSVLESQKAIIIYESCW